MRTATESVHILSINVSIYLPIYIQISTRLSIYPFPGRFYMNMSYQTLCLSLLNYDIECITL